MYDTIFFDLDGTITDPGIGITNSVAHALAKWNIHVEDRTTLYRFIGPPLIDSFQQFYGFSREDSIRSVEYYREYYRDRGIYENEVYPGIEDMLAALKRAGKKVVLATSKPEEFARMILEHFHIDGYFDFVAGATMEETRTKKTEVIAYALEQCGIRDVSSVVMVGDRDYDILGAKAFGMDSIGVLFGYGSREELNRAGATYLAETVEDILPLVDLPVG